MKTQLSLIILILSGMIVSMNCSLQAQAPPSFKYQAVVRDKSGQVVANQHITLRISILQSGVDGPEIYSELHSVATSELGLINVEVGRGKDPTGSLAAIGWGSGSHFLRIEMDPSGGMDFELVGVSQLLSVPYALYAEQAGSGGREADLDWEVIGNDVVTGHGGSYPTGNVGIGNNAPGSLLYVAKSMGEPTITIRNLGSGGGATYSMVDDLSGADWKFKATMYGGFKIRDHPNALDVLVMEPNSAANLLYVSSSDNVGMGTSTPNPSARLDVSSTNKGFLPPRLTTAERNSIVSPAAGLMIYNLTDLSLEIFNGTSWVSAASSGWSLTGNSGTDPATNFIGTTDNQPLMFRVNNLSAGEINPVNTSTFLGIQAGDNNTSGYSNVAIGAKALLSNTNRSNLVAVGDSALYNNGMGATLSYHATGNTAVGSKALYSNTTGYSNTANGYQALQATTAGSWNTATGYQALLNNSLGNFNQAFGYEALHSNLTGIYNTAVGSNALYSNINGYNNHAFGTEALYSNASGWYNLALGNKALYSNTTGDNNTAGGHSALYSNTTGHSNVAIGVGALYSNTVQSNLVAIGDSTLYHTDMVQSFNNVAIGSKALYANTIGNNNTACGYRALYDNTFGNKNTAAGSFALYHNTNGYDNTALGSNALNSNTGGDHNTASGNESLYHNTTGSNNTAIGYKALFYNVENNRSTAIGFEAMHYADNRETNSRETYNTAVGYGALEGSTTAANNTGRYNTAIGDEALTANASGIRNTGTGCSVLNSNTSGSYNAAFGNEALRDNTIGYFNVAVGLCALASNTNRSNLVAVGDSALYNNGLGASGDQATGNTAIGSRALVSNTTGYRNTASGYKSLQANTTGNWNTANGYQALYLNSTGSDNQAFGPQALYYNTTGSHNHAIGRGALFNNTTGYSNIAIGTRALFENTDRSNLVAIGDSALYKNGLNVLIPLDATGNTAIGSKALRYNTNGYRNTAIGYQALYSNTSGTNNEATGSLALYSNTTGKNNTAMGTGSLYSNSEGWYNIAIGPEALYNNTTHDNNTAVGTGACSSTNSNNNTAVGYYAGNLHTFSNGTFLGANAYPDDNGYTNCMALGYDAKATASNRVVIGNTSVTSIGGSVGWTNFSDGRFKNNIREDVPGLEFINQLRPVTYTLDVTSLNTDLNKNRPTTLREGEKPRMESQEDIENRLAKEKIVYTGFIAQEVEAAARAIGYDFSGVDAPQNADGHYGLRYAEFVVPLVKAIQEQQVMIEALQEEVRRLKEKQAAK
ncbi:MAG TPA: tail fiber domain-containing protein [Bacteroidales bacterium]|nr:tail fiber domain-containing protein [Bacteroidales bacterium]HNS46631.1 tail fiber domain-containing protein [Bacteroidales bacterium]